MLTRDRADLKSAMENTERTGKPSKRKARREEDEDEEEMEG